jgi:hypothetical protein
MKNIVNGFLVVAFLIFYSPIIAQENNDTETLLGDKLPQLSDLGFYIAPAYQFTQLDEAAASLFHIRGGISYKKQFNIGGFYNVSLNQIYPSNEVLPNVYMDYWNAGGYVEYTVLSKKLVHVTLPIYLGYGEVQMDNEMGELDLGEANFATFEPNLLLEINLHKYAKFNIGGGYRWVSEMNYRNFNQNDISGITASVGFKFGIF